MLWLSRITLFLGQLDLKPTNSIKDVFLSVMAGLGLGALEFAHDGISLCGIDSLGLEERGQHLLDIAGGVNLDVDRGGIGKSHIHHEDLLGLEGRVLEAGKTGIPGPIHLGAPEPGLEDIAEIFFSLADNVGKEVGQELVSGGEEAKQVAHEVPRTLGQKGTWAEGGHLDHLGVDLVPEINILLAVLGNVVEVAKDPGVGEDVLMNVLLDHLIHIPGKLGEIGGQLGQG